MKDRELFMRRALVLADAAREAGDVPVGAVVVRNDEIIGEGFNQQVALQDPTAHAEIVALRDAAARTGNYRLPGTVLFVTIEPCTMCAGALIHARVATLVFGAPEPRAGAIVSSARLLEREALNHRVEVVQGVLATECAETMRNFFAQRRGDRGKKNSGGEAISGR